jgi:hypothetical protein
LRQTLVGRTRSHQRSLHKTDRNLEDKEMTDEPEQPPTENDDPPEEQEPQGKGGGDGKSKALGMPGLGDRGRTKANEPTDD